MVVRSKDLARQLSESRTRDADELARTLSRCGEPLPPLRQVDIFSAAFDSFGAAQIVLLGEATHGTSEFYRARAAIRQYGCLTPWQQDPAYYGLVEQFDAWVWFEETTAVTPLPAGHAVGMPQTYPFGM